MDEHVQCNGKEDWASSTEAISSAGVILSHRQSRGVDAFDNSYRNVNQW